MQVSQSISKSIKQKVIKDQKHLHSRVLHNTVALEFCTTLMFLVFNIHKVFIQLDIVLMCPHTTSMFSYCC